MATLRKAWIKSRFQNENRNLSGSNFCVTSIQFHNCLQIADNLSLSSSINREFFKLWGNQSH